MRVKYNIHSETVISTPKAEQVKNIHLQNACKTLPYYIWYIMGKTQWILFTNDAGKLYLNKDWYLKSE